VTEFFRPYVTQSVSQSNWRQKFQTQNSKANFKSASFQIAKKVVPPVIFIMTLHIILYHVSPFISTQSRVTHDVKLQVVSHTKTKKKTLSYTHTSASLSHLAFYSSRARERERYRDVSSSFSRLLPTGISCRRFVFVC
jgi:hypothetical protein